MITCPNCGTQNEPGDRFCRECGADLRALGAPAASTSPSPQSAPPSLAAPQGQWQSPPIGAMPPPSQGRRTWLWIVIGVLAACLLISCGTSVYFFGTSAGQNKVEDWATRVNDWMTEVAPTPKP